MELQEFKQELKELTKKAQMTTVTDWSIVYDTDKNGSILVAKDGTIFFADRFAFWTASHLNLAI